MDSTDSWTSAAMEVREFFLFAPEPQSSGDAADGARRAHKAAIQLGHRRSRLSDDSCFRVSCNGLERDRAG